MESVPQVQKIVDGLGTQVDALKPLLEDLLTEDVEDLSPLDQANHYAAITYALDAVIFAYLKSIGADPKNHPISTELQRVKATMTRLAAAKNKPGEGLSTSSIPSTEPSRPRIDKEAAARFVKHSLGTGSSGATTNKNNSDAQATEFLKQMSQSIASKKK
ncbi:uncharacterized protein SAPINGB_P004086 [Magnusiomyces paraingens]|uniref:Exosome complex protein n=1 Tax=Magnusiomyces paraingens TaxID=2606893 RepID=A0A5E8BUW4_9ASCO|nr:uncharacterized protein SAPINGB_P004086 [Saprochaete ingens]VVT54459.1 unnamed protein product [Saprochaete ingens]